MADRLVYVVLEHPDMTYYGDAEIHGVYSSREAAEAHQRKLDPHSPSDISNYGVEEWPVSDEVVSDGRCLVCQPHPPHTK